jgi:outer membrane protein insertion porin family
MFGLLGVDYGWGFDPIPGVNEATRQKGVFHFMIGQQF